MTTIRTYDDHSVFYDDPHVNYDGSPVSLFILPSDNAYIPKSAMRAGSLSLGAMFPLRLAVGASMKPMVSRGASSVVRYVLGASYIPIDSEGAVE